ncbi:toll/interleukin-1 receptor domain-containing protein [Cellulophaga sp. F20128]|uniref:toll/interleukin-1 receptor domain-containing protein n=1 Tax=Cellulophaga sp. F20128 TaxID=2926413 RepID=UPI001FF434D9|nr:toll/interleukin-1 receptor domain-containing protein [Cellulophaga sp. F20128]MCK0157992.1 toll/interleukin-1 receptor domain-containing protein [Cellulophaga sp. F20128]
MGLFTESELRNKTTSEKRLFSKGLRGPVNLNESYDPNQTFDVFLSHSYLDKDIVLGIKLTLEEYGYSVYVDWIQDANLNRGSVNKETAAIIRERMKKCRALIHTFSINSSNSKWMPWELGYFDGIKSQVAVLPVTTTEKDSFKGAEYLDLYPFIKKAKSTGGDLHLWVHEEPLKYVMFHYWMTGHTPFNH